MALELREYQIAAIQKLREGFAAGHHSQVLYLGTGGGKTEIAIAMLEAAKKKGSKAAMLLDRIVLCDQTSSRLERYGIAHGVLQAGHWRYRPDEDIQDTPIENIEGFVEGVKQVLQTYPDTRKDNIQVFLYEFGSYSLDILINFFLQVPDREAELIKRQEIMLDILRLAETKGIRFAFPTQTLHIESLPVEKPTNPAPSVIFTKDT